MPPELSVGSNFTAIPSERSNFEPQAEFDDDNIEYPPMKISDPADENGYVLLDLKCFKKLLSKTGKLVIS